MCVGYVCMSTEIEWNRLRNVEHESKNVGLVSRAT